MNIDFDFIRNFLLAVEHEATDPVTPLTKEQLGFSQLPDGIYYRQMIHFERAELVETIYQTVDKIPQRFPGRLTEAGFKLLAKIRDEKVWQRIISIQTGEMATFSLAVLIALADRVAQLEGK
jgi:hypothetical protein